MILKLAHCLAISPKVCFSCATARLVCPDRRVDGSTALRGWAERSRGQVHLALCRPALREARREGNTGAMPRRGAKSSRSAKEDERARERDELALLCDDLELKGKGAADAPPKRGAARHARHAHQHKPARVRTPASRQQKVPICAPGDSPLASLTRLAARPATTPSHLARGVRHRVQWTSVATP